VAITDVGNRHRARILSSLLLVILFSAIAGACFVPPNVTLTMSVFAGVVVLCYGLSRTRYYYWGGVLIIGATGSLSFATICLEADYSTFAFIRVFAWHIIALTLAQIFFTSRGLLILLCLTFVGLAGYPLLSPRISFENVSGAAGLLGTVGLLLWAAQHNRRSIEHDRIREIKRESEARQQAQRAAEAASEAKSTFVANMSHELRTPLNSIIGYTEMVVEEMVERGPECDEMREDLDRVVASSHHLIGLINDILDLAKIESGKLAIVAEEVSLIAVFDEVVSVIAPLAESNGNRLITHCSAEGMIIVDGMRLRQMLINMLSNAAKFTEDGEISLRVWEKERIPDPLAASEVLAVYTSQKQELPTTGVERWLVFEVRDTGIGMTEAQLAQVFERFGQAEETTARRFGGSGIGLTLTLELCQLMGGVLHAESRQDIGSTFTIYLPWV